MNSQVRYEDHMIIDGYLGSVNQPRPVALYSDLKTCDNVLRRILVENKKVVPNKNKKIGYIGRSFC